MSDAIDLKLADNLRHGDSPAPRGWCDARRGQWSRGNWLRLLGSLWWSEYWPMDVAAVQAVLDEYAKPWNLGRWHESGLPLQWIEAHHGVWGHEDWLDLLGPLRQSALAVG